MVCWICGKKLELAGHLAFQFGQNGGFPFRGNGDDFVYAVGFYLMFGSEDVSILQVLLKKLIITVHWFVGDVDSGFVFGIMHLHPMLAGKPGGVG